MKINTKVKFETKALDPLAAFQVVDGTPSPTLVASAVEVSAAGERTVELPAWQWDKITDFIYDQHLKVVGPRIVSRGAFGQKTVEFFLQGEGNTCMPF